MPKHTDTSKILILGSGPIVHRGLKRRAFRARRWENEFNSVIPSEEDRPRSERSSQSRDLLLACGADAAEAYKWSLHAENERLRRSFASVGMTGR